MVLEAMCAIINRICCITQISENSPSGGGTKEKKTHNANAKVLYKDNCNQEYSENSERIIVKILIEPREKTFTCNQVCEQKLNSKSLKTRQQQQNAQKKWQITSATIDQHSNGFLSNLDEPHKRNVSSTIQDPSKVISKAAESKNSTEKYSASNVTTATSYLPYVPYNAKKMEDEINENISTIYPLTSTKTDSKYMNKRSYKKLRKCATFYCCFKKK